MTTKATDTTKYYATKDFIDAGTERLFEHGKEMDIDVGTAANYLAAGLASTENPVADKPSTAKAAA